MGPAALHVGWLASRVPRGQKELRAGKRLELVMEVLTPCQERALFSGYWWTGQASYLSVGSFLWF